MKPTQIVLEILTTCNFHCSYCRDDSGAKRMVPFEEVIHLVNEFAGLGIKKVQLDGGEPFLHPRVLEMIDYIVERGLDPGVYTNASLIDGQTAECLKQIPRLKLAVTLHPLNAADELEATLSGLKCLYSAGLQPHLVFVVSQQSLPLLASTVARLPSEDFHLVLNPLVRSGRAFDNDVPGLADSDRELLVSTLSEIAQQRPGAHVVNNVPLTRTHAASVENIQLNAHAEFALHVNTNGDVLPFFSAGADTAIGNVADFPGLRRTLADPKTMAYLARAQSAMQRRIAAPELSSSRRISRAEIMERLDPTGVTT
jgi:MoaA/NifB/PqqE/SkfB family radical SAM enzyme